MIGISSSRRRSWSTRQAKGSSDDDYGHELLFGAFIITPLAEPAGRAIDLAMAADRVGLDLAGFRTIPTNRPSWTAGRSCRTSLPAPRVSPQWQLAELAKLNKHVDDAPAAAGRDLRRCDGC